MALATPNFPNPLDPTTPLASVYSCIAGLGIDFSSNNWAGAFRLTINVYANAAAANFVPTPPPVEQVSFSLGDTLVPANGSTPAVVMPTLATYMTDPQFAAAFAYIETKLYTDIARLHPKFAGSTQVS